MKASSGPRALVSLFAGVVAIVVALGFYGHVRAQSAASASLWKALPAKNVYRIETELTPPKPAEMAYEDTLRACFGISAGVPPLDLVFLGLRPDGHTASLFPNSPLLHDTTRLIAADFVAKFNMWRITMTARLFNAARVAAFLVAGQDKAPIFRDVLCSDEPERLPAQLIQPAEGPLWIVDQAAASLVR